MNIDYRSQCEPENNGSMFITLKTLINKAGALEETVASVNVGVKCILAYSTVYRFYFSVLMRMYYCTCMVLKLYDLFA